MYRLFVNVFYVENFFQYLILKLRNLGNLYKMKIMEFVVDQGLGICYEDGRGKVIFF